MLAKGRNGTPEKEGVKELKLLKDRNVSVTDGNSGRGDACVVRASAAASGGSQILPTSAGYPLCSA